MSIEIIAIIVAIVVPVSLHLLSNSNKSRKEYFLDKFQGNKNKMQFVISDFKKITDLNDDWNKRAFKDSEITSAEYFEMMKSNYEKEYSDIQFEALKRKKFSKSELEEYISKLKVQEDNLNLIKAELEFKKKKLSN